MRNEGRLRPAYDVHLAVLPVQFGLDPLSVTDVMHDCNETRRLALRRNVLQKNLNRYQATALMLVDGLERQRRLAPFQERRYECAKLFLGEFRLDVERPHAQQLIPAVPHLVDCTPVDIEEPQI